MKLKLFSNSELLKLETNVNEYLKTLPPNTIVDRQLASHFCSTRFPSHNYTIALWCQEPVEEPSPRDLPQA